MVRQFRDVQEPLQSGLEFHEHAEVRHFGHLASEDGAGDVRLRNPSLPRVFFHLLQAQGDALLVLVHAEDDASDLLALFEHLGRMADLLRPRHVAGVEQAVDAFLDLDERAVVGEVSHDALDDRSRRILFLDQHPGVDLGLLHAEADLLLGLVDRQDDDLDLFRDADHLRRVVDAPRPGHLADVHEALDARLEPHERAVGGDVGDLALDLRADRVPRLDVVPRRGA